jgi:2-polyprenyl-3-methyl-5-hydroxy-6-metoxy-1,4-benzoquinol methylase
MVFLRQRCREAEIMDQPDLDPRRHTQALSALARINFVSRGSAILFAPLIALQRRLRTDRLRILDVATGAGDVPVRLWRRAARAGLHWDLAGCDLSPVAVEHARIRALANHAPVHFFVHDALANPLPGPYDAVVCSLFLHHLDEEQARTLLKAMANLQAGGPSLVLVNDLNRTLHELALVYLATRLLTTSGVVHTDGPRSVRAAFTPIEARALAEQAGLHGAVVKRRWPCRWLLSWSRPT